MGFKHLNSIFLNKQLPNKEDKLLSYNFPFDQGK